MYGIQELSKRCGDDAALEGEMVYHASKDSVAEASIRDRHLIVKGVYVDRITQVSSITDKNIGTAIEKSWTPGNIEDSYITGGTIGEAFLHTLVADVQRVGQQAQYRGYAMDWDFDDDQRKVIDGEENLQRKYMRASMRNATFLRRLMWTEKGYMGLAPAAAATGDKVYLFFGGQVLYVLRQKGEAEHEFMGECYVHGLMDGAAVDTGAEGAPDIYSCLIPGSLFPSLKMISGMLYSLLLLVYVLKTPLQHPLLHHLYHHSQFLA